MKKMKKWKKMERRGERKVFWCGFPVKKKFSVGKRRIRKTDEKRIFLPCGPLDSGNGRGYNTKVKSCAEEEYLFIRLQREGGW